MASSTLSAAATWSASLSKRLSQLPLREISRARPVEMPETPDAVVLELEEPLGVVERLLSSDRDDRLYPREHHVTDMGAFTSVRR